MASGASSSGAPAARFSGLRVQRTRTFRRPEGGRASVTLLRISPRAAASVARSHWCDPTLQQFPRPRLPTRGTRARARAGPAARPRGGRPAGPRPPEVPNRSRRVLLTIIKEVTAAIACAAARLGPQTLCGLVRPTAARRRSRQPRRGSARGGVGYLGRRPGWAGPGQAGPGRAGPGRAGRDGQGVGC